ncbi:E3 ubiquitin-protein ligase TRIM71-like [Mytilus californianus]|uniref:E3 ubiquitin-protein ligase TRIM71-like n=1 Tax=Mytilus californianus TaxID=6549 RepID=UPI0022450BE5|nr:E3 ubiquitin-protein ligase TRIM71-like [Mytilus californianus]
MATASFCDPCTEANSSVSATKYCSDCEERLCPDCAESHTRFKAFKSHHVIDLSSVDSNIPISAKKICNVHPDMLLDYYCKDHDIVCCRACIPKDHRKCENVLPLEHASKDVKKSALFTDIMADINHLITTLNDLHDNRESNLQSLAQTKSVMTKQIREVKSRLLKQIDDLERNLHAELSSLQRKHEIEISKQKEEISQVLDKLKENENEIYFLKDYGSDSQLFLCLHQQVINSQSAEEKVQKLVSRSQEINITFDEKKVITIDSFGSLLETLNSCQVQYITKKLQQAQIKVEATKTIFGFEKDTELKLKTGITYVLRDLAITDDNKLLLTNHSLSDPKLYVYRDCKDYETEITFSAALFGVAVIPGTDCAIVTLPAENSIQFIKTKQMTTSDKVNVGLRCFGITASRDRIYISGQGGIIKTLDINGTVLKYMQQTSENLYFMLYDDSHDHLIVRYNNKLLCIKLDGTHVYSKDTSSVTGVILDRQGYVYFGGYYTHNIQRMSSDWTKCETMLNRDDEIDHPYGMCLNNDFTKLFVINNGCKSVFVYKCKTLTNE